MQRSDNIIFKEEIVSANLQIEVTVKEGDSSTERGALLENLIKRVLCALQYTHVRTTVRVTGCDWTSLLKINRLEFKY